MTAPQKGRIFISYRRADSAGYAGRIYDRLSAHFGKEAIFMDVDTIEAGLDFVEVLENAVQSCDVLVALIGKQWLNIKDATGKRRLDNPEDFVRIEIAAALKRNIRVIPVLVDGVNTPSSTELPHNLKPLARRNALQVNHHAFNADAHRLISQMELALSAVEESKVLKAQALEKAAQEKAKREAAEKATQEKLDREAAEKAAKDKAEREAKLRTSLDEVDRIAAERIAKEKAEQETDENAAREKIIQTWWGRSLFGAILGLVIGSIYLLISGEEIILYFVGSCSLVGPLAYPHKLTYLLLIVGFISLGLAEFAFEPDFYLFWAFGGLYGIPAGALLSRVFHWLKIIK